MGRSKGSKKNYLELEDLGREAGGAFAGRDGDLYGGQFRRSRGSAGGGRRRRDWGWENGDCGGGERLQFSLFFLLVSVTHV
jgi:hypothetical protein